MPRPPRVIAFLIASPFQLLDLTGPADVFSVPATLGKNIYSLQMLSTTGGNSVRSTGGVTIANACKFSQYTGPIDTLITIGGEGSLEHQSPELLQWLRKRAPNIRRIAAVCTGAFILAATGLLDGKRVTTHWRYLDDLIKRFKNLKVERDPIFIKDGKFYTTAGVSAGVDLSLALVEEDLGHEIAATVARELVLFLRRPGSQAQYSTLLAQQATMSDVRMRGLPAHAESHLTHKLDVNALAAFVVMSPRTFARQFEGHFGTTPARWVRSLRVEAARQHLESRNLSLKEIARVTGFRNEQALRRAFTEQVQMSPKEYRERFGAGE